MSTIFTLPAYVGIILRKDDTVFLIQRRNTNWASGYWNFPGGLVEKDESLIQAAIRETQEEVGVLVSAHDFKLVHVLHVRKNESNTQDIIGFYFSADRWQGMPSNNEPHKILDAQWFAIDNLPSAITEHAQLAIAGFMKKSSYSESGW